MHLLPAEPDIPVYAETDHYYNTLPPYFPLLLTSTHLRTAAIAWKALHMVLFLCEQFHIFPLLLSSGNLSELSGSPAVAGPVSSGTRH